MNAQDDDPQRVRRVEISTEDLARPLANSPPIAEPTPTVPPDKKIYSATSEAHVAGEFYRLHDRRTLHPRFGCLLIVRGGFGARHIAGIKSGTDQWSSERLALFGLAHPPDLFVVLRIRYLGAPYATHLLFEAETIELRRTAARWVRHDGRMDLFIKIGMSTTQAEGSKLVRLVTNFDVAFRDVRLGSESRGKALHGIMSHAAPLPRLMSDRLYRYNAATLLAPVSISVTLLETETLQLDYWDGEAAKSAVRKRDAAK